MSYDLYLKIFTGKEDTTVVTIGNYTSNVWPMYEMALKYARSKYPGQFPLKDDDLDSFNGISAQVAIPVLRLALQHMNAVENYKSYIALNPPNDWGDFRGGHEYLEQLLTACERHPLCKIEVS